MLISFTDKGLYCNAGDFYIDPWSPVKRAVITHAHSDHARPGHQYYLCHTYTKPLLQARLGDNNYESIGWNEPVNMNGVKVSLHPAGHMIGSSQIRVEYQGEITVVSGDYKLENDGISDLFEPITCHNFITESTFGLPIYKWKPQALIYSEIQKWVMDNKAHGKTSVLLAYSLGKAQRILEPLSALNEPIYVHGAIWNMHQVLVAAGFDLPPVIRITPDTNKAQLKGSIVIAPPSADASPWIKRFLPYSLGICSGWMQVRGNIRRRNADAGFVLSDHADWKGLLTAIEATGAENIFVTHGFQSVLSRYLNENGLNAREVKTEYGGEEEFSIMKEENNVNE